MKASELIIVMYGVNNPNKTLSDIAEKFNTSPQRVSVLTKKYYKEKMEEAHGTLS